MIFSLQTSQAPASVPERRFVLMPAQAVVPLTPMRAMRSAWEWLIAETNDQGPIKISKG
jgi:hypothetical protein